MAEEWNGVRRWFRGGAGEAPPWHELDRALGDAIEWIISSAQRLIDRRTRRVDRAAEYRALALLFDRARSLEDCHALYAAVFGLYQPRHFSVPEADPELTAPTVLVAGRAGAGRGVALPAGDAAARSRSCHRCPTTRWRARPSPSVASASARSSEPRSGASPAPAHYDSISLRRLDVLEFRHLLRWLGRALDSAADQSGTAALSRRTGSCASNSGRRSQTTPAWSRSPRRRARSRRPTIEIEVIAC